MRVKRDLNIGQWHKGVVTVINLQPASEADIQTALRKKGGKKLISLFWFMFCAICFLSHSVFITDKYLIYDTTTEVKTNYERNFSPPIISFCRPLMEMVRITSENHAICSGRASRNTSRCATFIFDHPLKDVMTEMTRSLLDTILNIDDKPKIFNQKGDIDELVVEFFKSYLKCIQIKRPNRILDIRAMLGWNEANLKTVMKTTLNISDIAKGLQDGEWFKFYKPFVGIIFHGYSTLPHLYDNDIYWYDIDSNQSRNSYQFAFDTQQFHLLPSPYASSCVESYPEQVIEGRPSKKIVSMGHCFESCTRSGVFKKTGIRNGLFTAKIIDSDEKLAPPHKVINFDSDTNDFCSEKCHRKCLTVFYLPTLMNRYESFNNERFGIRVEMYRPQTQIRLSPLFPLDSYLIFLGSIAGLWFGWSIHASVGSVVEASLPRVINLWNDY